MMSFFLKDPNRFLENDFGVTLWKTLQYPQNLPRKFFTHATPTLFNAGTPHPQMSSCFLLKMQGDSIDGIYDTLKQCAVISKSAGGIGVAATWHTEEGMLFFHQPPCLLRNEVIEVAFAIQFPEMRTPAESIQPRFPIFVPVAPTSAAPTVGAMAWCQCCGTSTRRRVTLIKAEDL